MGFAGEIREKLESTGAHAEAHARADYVKQKLSILHWRTFRESWFGAGALSAAKCGMNAVCHLTKCLPYKAGKISSVLRSTLAVRMNSENEMRHEAHNSTQQNTQHNRSTHSQVTHETTGPEMKVESNVFQLISFSVGNIVS